MLASIKYAKIISRCIGDANFTGVSVSSKSFNLALFNNCALPIPTTIKKFERLNKLDERFSLPQDIKVAMWGPPLPRPEFDACFCKEILDNSKGTRPLVLFQGPSSLGKTTALLTTLAGVSYSYIADEKRLIGGLTKTDDDKGFPGVVYLSLRGQKDSNAFALLACATGIEKFTDEIDLGIQFRMMVSDFNKRYSGRPVYVVIEDIIFHLC